MYVDRDEYAKVDMPQPVEAEKFLRIYIIC